MAHDSQRDKARALFGKAFFENTKEKAPAKNGAVALQQRANARPIPTYKVGGVVKKQAGGRMSGQSAEADDVLITTPRGQRMLEEQRRREREAAAKAKAAAAAKRAKADTLLGIPAQKEGGRANEDFTGLMKKAASRAAAKGNPVMKDGGATNEYIGKRINARMAAGNYKDGGRAEMRNERKMADIEKDYKIALAKGKNEGVAKAKYEQRKADAADDYAKATKADRSVTRGAEKAAESALKEARRTKGVSISNRDNAESFMQKNSNSVAPKINVAETLKGLGVMPAAADKAAAPARKAAAPRQAAPVRQARTSVASPSSAPTRSAAPSAPAVGSRSNPIPANPKEEVVVTGKRIGRSEAARNRVGDAISSINPFSAIARGIDSVLTAGTGPRKPAAPEQSKSQKLAQLKAAADAPGATGFAKGRYKSALESGMYKSGGKVRNSKMKGC
jgi:histone H1/5